MWVIKAVGWLTYSFMIYKPKISQYLFLKSTHGEKLDIYTSKTEVHFVQTSLYQPFFNTLGPRQNGRPFADDIFKCIFLNKNVRIPIKTSLKFVLKGPIINIPALVQIKTWRRPCDKPLFEPMMVSLPTHICVTRPQGIKKQLNEAVYRDAIRWYVSSVYSHQYR